MFRRLFWLIMGAGFGFGVSFWLMRMVRETVQRYSPDRLSTDLGDALRQLGSDVRAAVAEGREAMHETEARLRADIEHGGAREVQATPLHPEGRIDTYR
jgi:hypothetical protein